MLSPSCTSCVPVVCSWLLPSHGWLPALSVHTYMYVYSCLVSCVGVLCVWQSVVCFPGLLGGAGREEGKKEGECGEGKEEDMSVGESTTSTVHASCRVFTSVLLQSICRCMYKACTVEREWAIYVQMDVVDLQLVPPSVKAVENSMSSFLHAVSQLLWYSPRRIQSLVPFYMHVCAPVQPTKLPLHVRTVHVKLQLT